MRIANYLTRKSVVYSMENHNNTWGGPRNKSDRISHVLPLKSREKIILAAHYAYELGLPLNRFVTINWEKAGLTDREAAEATARFIKYVADYLYTKNHKSVCCWVRENPRGGGSHVHILLHWPIKIELGKHLLNHVKKISKSPYKKGVIKTNVIKGKLGRPEFSEKLYFANLNKLVSYICKGISETDVELLGVNDQKNQGTIIGKRSGTSQKLNYKGPWRANQKYLCGKDPLFRIEFLY